jgi:hypothetical protein
MATLLEIEQAASKFRQCLQNGRLPELRLLCGLKFMALLASAGNAFDPESYLREFVPFLAADARKCNASEFLPDETSSLGQFINLLSSHTDIVRSDDMQAFQNLHTAALAASGTPIVTPAGTGARVTCLFVEYYPDLDLAPRGRLLSLSVTAVPITAKAQSDDIVVRNPVAEPDDRFLAQARNSVAAARSLLWRRYKLPMGKRYRFDFAVDSTGARFTGDSLGIAFATGAIAALSRIEVFRDRLSISPQAAFSGALSADGHVLPIDDDALKLKIYRAFHSGVKYLVIPRNHITTAWEYLTELEKETAGTISTEQGNGSTGGRLELMGAETLDSIVSDPRLLPRTRSSATSYLARKAWQTKRSAWVEIPALLALAMILFILIAPARWMPWFDRQPEYSRFNVVDNRLEVLNRDSILIWSSPIDCKIYGDELAERRKIYDIDGDGKNEVLVLTPTLDNCQERGMLTCYSSRGKMLFRRFCGILNEYPGDSSSVLFEALRLNAIANHGNPIIITEVFADDPGCAHIALWNSRGDRIGWYINWGGSRFCLAHDIDHDGHDELFFLNYNNPMNCVALLVLKPDSSSGISPPYDSPERESVKRGNQLAYILFPPTDLGRVHGELRNEYNEPGSEGVREDVNGQFKAYAGESNQGSGIEMIYILNDRLRVVNAEATDQFIKRRRELVKDEKLPPQDQYYYSRLRDSSRYWAGSGWVTEGQLRTAR